MNSTRSDGTPTESSSDVSPVEVAAELSPTEKPVPLSAAVLGVATVSGVLAAWLASVLAATWLNLPVEVWAFLLVWAGTTGYFSFEDLPSAVLGGGFHLGAAFVVVEPVRAFGPAVVGGDGAGTAVGAGDLFVWGLVTALVAGAFLLVGRRLRRRAERLDRRATRRRVNYHR